MTAPLTLTAYAERRGCSVKSVSIAVRDRRLVESVGRNDRGQPVILDPELADREWTANTRRRADVPAREPASSERAAASQPPQSEAAAAPAPRQREASLSGVPAYNVSRDLRAAADARNAILRADLAELELAEKRGRLVDADRARADVFARISMAKTLLLSVPTLVAQDAPELAGRIVPLIERRIREALEELSADGRGA